MTARPSIARRVVISPAAVVVLLIGLWAILGTWQDEAAARAVPRPVAPRGPLRPSEQATIDLVEKTLAMWSTSREAPDQNSRGTIAATSLRITTSSAYGSGAQVRLSDEHDAPSSLVGVSTLVDL